METGKKEKLIQKAEEPEWLSEQAHQKLAFPDLRKVNNRQKYFGKQKK